MTAPVAHVVLTRFAIRVGSFDGVAAPEAPLGAAWVRRRLELFERYCLPSMRAQTLTDWTWRLYVHAGFDPAIAAYLAACDPRIVVTRDSLSPLPAQDAAVLCSTRLDSDDGLAATALETSDGYVAAFLASGDPVRVLCLKHGYHLDHARRVLYRGRGWAFQTMYEHGPGVARGVLVESCDTINRTYPTWIHDREAWVRVVHGGNLRNRFEPRTRPLVARATLSRSRRFAFLAAARVA